MNTVFKDIPTYVAEQKEILKKRISEFDNPPVLTVMQLGDDSASNSYILGKKRDCEEVGIIFNHEKYDYLGNEWFISTDFCVSMIQQACEHIPKRMKDSLVYRDFVESDGVMLQLPVPDKFDAKKITDAIYIRKDVDGFRSNSHFDPCTAKGIIDYLAYCEYPLEGKNALVIGRSDIVGKPLARMLLDRNATVTLAHSKSYDIDSHITNADIIFTATSHVNSLSLFPALEYNDRHPMIIDIGLGRYAGDGKLHGNLWDGCLKTLKDYNYEVISGTDGVGLLTRLALLQNVVKAAEMR